MDDAIRNVLSKRKDRTIATILGAKDDLCDDFNIPDEDSQELRKVILDQVNDFYNLCADLLRSVQPEGVVMNETYLQKLDEIHEALVVR